jgi:hypothetical protein
VFRVWGSGFKVLCSGFVVQVLRFCVQGFGFRVQGFVFSVWGPGFKKYCRVIAGGGISYQPAAPVPYTESHYYRGTWLMR